jgi:hypothetical protein
VSEVPEFNVDFGLLILLLCTSTVVYAYMSQTNSYISSCGLLAVCYLARDFVGSFFFGVPSTGGESEI